VKLGGYGRADADRAELSTNEGQRGREAPLREPDIAVSHPESFGGSTEGGDKFEVGGTQRLPPALARGVAEGRR
jgi:hypothetical protein